MTDFGQIPTAMIRRFHELSKTEIIVICYLYALRNRKTGQCNPRQKQIAEAVGIATPHVSSAIKQLISRGFLSLSDDRQYRFAEETNSYENGNSAPAAKSYGIGNKSYGIGNLHNKDINIEGTEKEQKEKNALIVPSKPPADFIFPVHAFEHPAVNLIQEKMQIKVRRNFAEEVARRVTDLGLWTSLLNDKIAFADQPLAKRQNVPNWILIEYDKRVQEKTNGTNTRPSTFREQRDAVARNENTFYDDLRRSVRGSTPSLSISNNVDSTRQLQVGGTEPDA